VAAQLAVLVADVLSRYGQNAACTTELAAADSSTVHQGVARAVRAWHAVRKSAGALRCIRREPLQLRVDAEREGEGDASVVGRQHGVCLSRAVAAVWGAHAALLPH
jgi:hypothetical protein